MAGVVVTMSGDEARLFRAMQKVVDQQDKVNNKFKDIAKNSDDVGKKSKDAFEKSGLSINKMSASLVTYAAGLASVTGAVGLLRSGWEQVRKEQEAGLSQLQRTQVQDRRLLQISNAEQFTARRDQADQLASQFGVDRAVVREVLFAGISEGFEDAVPAIIAANQAVDPLAAAGVAGQAPALFNKTITALEAVTLTLKAAEASRLDFEKIAIALPSAAEGAGIAQATAEETLAVLSILAAEFGSGQIAADRIKAFSTRVGLNEDLSGQGIIGPLEKIIAMDESSRRALLGTDQEINVAFVKMVKNLDLIKQKVAEFNQESEAFAAGNGLLSQKVDIAANDPRSIALINEARARQALESAQAGVSGITGAAAAEGQAIAQTQLLARSLLARIIGSQIVPALSQIGAEFGLSSQNIGSLGSETSGFLATSARFSGAGPFALLAPVADKLLEAAGMLSGTANKLDAASARMGNTTPAARAAASGASF